VEAKKSAGRSAVVCHNSRCEADICPKITLKSQDIRTSGRPDVLAIVQARAISTSVGQAASLPFLSRLVPKLPLEGVREFDCLLSRRLWFTEEVPLLRRFGSAVLFSIARLGNDGFTRPISSGEPILDLFG
jgi:hypothetical protein